jgi:multiple antibiotic resistance protein
MALDDFLNIFIVMWAVIDPIGTVPVFIAITNRYDINEKKHIARQASIISFIILASFLVAGEFVLRNMGVPIAAFQTSGGVILFLFAINMIFGSSKPEDEIELVKNSNETAVFPLAIPSIASPGAILAVVLLSEGASSSSTSSLVFNSTIMIIVLIILLINYLFMRLSDKILLKIGKSGAIVISKIMGLILASMAANNILMGIKAFFKL